MDAEELGKTLTGIAVSIGEINTKMDTNTSLTQKVADAIYGNNGEGLKTIAALNRSSIKRIWWWMGGVSLSVAGIASYVIKTGILKG